MTGKNTAVVDFAANGFTSASTARDYAFRRAAELTLERGYDYFLVENGSDKIQTTKSSGSVDCYSYGNTTNCYGNDGIEFNKPITTLYIRMFKGTTPDKTGYYDARYFK